MALKLKFYLIRASKEESEKRPSSTKVIFCMANVPFPTCNKFCNERIQYVIDTYLQDVYSDQSTYSVDICYKYYGKHD